MDKLMLLYSLVITSLITISFLTLGMMNFVMRITAPHRKTFNEFIFLCFHGSHSFTFFFIFYLWIHRNAFIESLHTLDNFEIKFRKMKLKINKNPVKKNIIYLEIFSPLFCGFVFYLGGNTISGIAQYLCFTIMLLGIALIFSQFNAFVDTVYDFFQTSLKFLMSVKHPVSYKNLITVEKLVDIVNQLVPISIKINAIYAQQLLILIVVSYIAVISHLYYIYRNGISIKGFVHPHIPGDCVMILYRFFVLWRLVHSAAAAKNKVCVSYN